MPIIFHVVTLFSPVMITQDELALMQEMFKSMDLDGTGKIRWDSARVVMSKMGRKMSDEQFSKLVDRYDIDKNGDFLLCACSFCRIHTHTGELEFSEFCTMYLDHMKRRVKNNDTLLEVFAFLDRTESGRVSRKDVRCTLANGVFVLSNKHNLLHTFLPNVSVSCF